MLRTSCQSFCCVRPLAARSLSLATASSSTASSSASAHHQPHASTSTHIHPPDYPRTAGLLVDPSRIRERDYAHAFPAFPPQVTPTPPRPEPTTEVRPPPFPSPAEPVRPTQPLSEPAPIASSSSSTPHPSQHARSALRPFQDIDVDRPPNEPRLTDEQLVVLEDVRRGKSVFFTGAAGTGKSVLLRAIIRALTYDQKRCAVTATTGIAAVNLGQGARTVHSWSGVGFGRQPLKRALEIMGIRAELAKNRPNAPVSKKSKQLVGLEESWVNTQVLIIDEVSMLDGRTLDELDIMGRVIRSQEVKANRLLPFGGLQIVFAGDFYQLPPVSSNDSEPIFAFESKAWGDLIRPSGRRRNCHFLRQVHRQRDPLFADLLNRLRVGQSTKEDLALLKKCKRRVEEGGEGATVVMKLFAHRDRAAHNNEERLAALKGEVVEYEAADVVGEKLRSSVARGRNSWADVKRLVEKLDQNSQLVRNLRLKVGAQVMMLKNQVHEGPEGDAYIVNGMQGVVTELGENHIHVRFPNIGVIALGPVSEHHGDNITRKQFPLKLAYATTIHKSQGQTLEKVIVNARHCWEAGQIYVALSRATSLEGLQIDYLNTKNPGLKANPRVLEFMKGFALDDVQGNIQPRAPVADSRVG